MELSDYRNQIDHIDKELIRLFAERMDVAAEIAAYKKEHGLAVLDPARERAKLLINIAHPQFRGQLWAAYYERYGKED